MEGSGTTQPAQFEVPLRSWIRDSSMLTPTADVWFSGEQDLLRTPSKGLCTVSSSIADIYLKTTAATATAAVTAELIIGLRVTHH